MEALLDEASPVMTSVDWGSVPAYFGGVALAFTAATIWRDRKIRERGQAERVAAWSEKTQDGWKLWVRNASDLPVSAVYVEAIPRGESSRADKPMTGKCTELGPECTLVIDYYVGAASAVDPPLMTFTD